MRLAAGGAPVAVNRSTKVRSSLYKDLDYLNRYSGYAIGWLMEELRFDS
jgi:hypothetical protein